MGNPAATVEEGKLTITSLRRHCYCIHGSPASLPQPDRRRGQIDAVVSAPPLSSLLWFDRYLEYPIQAFAKDPVPLFDLVKRKAVRQQSRQIYAPVPDYFHQPAHPLFAAWT